MVAARFAVLATLFTLPATGLVAAQADPTPDVVSRVIDLVAGVARLGEVERVSADVDIDAVGFSWQGAVGGAVEFRVQTAGGWSEWTEVEGDPAEGPDHDSPEYKGLTTAGPVWVDSGRRDVEVRVAQGPLAGLRLHAIRADRGASGPLSVQPAGADPAWSSTAFRSQWGADESWRRSTPDCRNGHARYAPNVNFAVLHHTDTANDYAPADVPAILRAIYHFHVFTNGWCDVGYNAFVDRFGRSFEGRAGGLDRAVVGAHAAGFNTASTGIAMLGRFHQDVVPQAMYDGVRRFLAWKLYRHGVDPRASLSVQSASDGDTAVGTGALREIHGITGHRDLGSTICPGDRGEALLPALRADVQRDMLLSVPFPLEGRVPAANGPSLLTLDAHGGLHPAGAQAAVRHTAHWPGQDIVRGAVRAGAAASVVTTGGSGSGGYVLDGWGALHPFGGAPPTEFSAYWKGWDIARSVAPNQSLLGAGGWVLSGWGTLHPYGGAPFVTGGPEWRGWDIARDVASQPGRTGGYVLSGWGSIHAFGTAPPVVGSGYWHGWDIARAIALRPDGVSGYVVSGWGSIHPFGGAPKVTGTLWTPGRDTARDVVLTDNGNGGWVVDVEGKLHPFGNAAPVAPSLTWTGVPVGKAVL